MYDHQLIFHPCITALWRQCNDAACDYYNNAIVREASTTVPLWQCLLNNVLAQSQATMILRLLIAICVQPHDNSRSVVHLSLLRCSTFARGDNNSVYALRHDVTIDEVVVRIVCGQPSHRGWWAACMCVGGDRAFPDRGKERMRIRFFLKKIFLPLEIKKFNLRPKIYLSFYALQK